MKEGSSLTQRLRYGYKASTLVDEGMKSNNSYRDRLIGNLLNKSVVGAIE